MRDGTVCRTARVSAAVIGWVAAVANASFMPGGTLGVEFTMVALSLAIVATLAIIVNCYQRPLGRAYDLGYHEGRKDAIREANVGVGGRARVTPLQPRTLIDLEPIRGPRKDRAPV